MYITLKIRIKATKEVKALLLKYESIYHNELKRIAKVMKESGIITYKGLQISRCIDRNSHWVLYQLALKKYHASCDRKRFQYERSSTWSIQSFSYYDGILVLYFGYDFSVPQSIVALSLTDKESECLEKSRNIRLDITHDEKFWFANFILQTNE